MADTTKYVKQLRIGNDIANIKDEECRDDLNNYKNTMSEFLTLGGGCRTLIQLKQAY